VERRGSFQGKAIPRIDRTPYSFVLFIFLFKLFAENSLVKVDTCCRRKHATVPRRKLPVSGKHLTDSCTREKWPSLQSASQFDNPKSIYENQFLASHTNIGYKCEDGRFLKSASCVTNIKPRFDFQQWNRAWSWNKKLKKHWFEWARCQKFIGGIHFTETWRAENLQPGLEFDNFKPWLKSGIFECISWLNGSCFGDNQRGFLKEGVKTNLMAPMLFSIFTSIVYAHDRGFSRHRQGEDVRICHDERQNASYMKEVKNIYKEGTNI
jgi:hypothetical protein